MPYLGSGTRVDGFAALTWSEESKQPVINWRSAPNFVRATERRVLADQRLTQANQMQATVGLMVALPVGAAAALPYTAVEVTWTSLGWSAATGGLVQTGFGRLAAWANGMPYGPSEAGLDFVQGATFGLTNKVIGGMGLSAPLRAGVELAATSSAGIAWGTARSGHFDLDAVLGNTVTAVAMQGTGSAIGWAWRKAKGSLMGLLFDAAETAPPTPAAVKEEVLPPPPQPEVAPARMLEQIFDFNGVAVVDEIRALPAQIARRMGASRIPQVRETVQRLRSGALKVKFYGKGAKVPDPSSAIKDTSEWWAYWSKKTPDTLWMNADVLASEPFHEVFTTSIVVHESIHAMGGNELCSFLGQARFILESGHWASLPNQNFRSFLVTYAKNQLSAAIKAIGADESAGGIFGYAKNGSRWIQPRVPDPWVIQQGGWARVLQVPHQGLDMAVLGPTLARTLVTQP
jgi:hypothetical protein